MKRLFLLSCAALLVLVPALTFAQSRPAPAGGGSSSGSASPRGDSGSSGGSSGGSTNSSSGSTYSGGSGYGSGARPTASPVSLGTGRYDGPRSGESTGAARPRTSGTSVGQAVPVSERPRGDRPVYGYAITRADAAARRANNAVNVPNIYGDYYGPYWWDPGYFGFYGLYGPYGSYYYGSPYGLWNTSWLYPDMWWAGLGPMYGYGMFALPMSQYADYWYSAYGAAASASYIEPTTGSIKLKVKPKTAEVYVDGTYYGQVDHYDGAFQHLDLKAGTHKVEIRANGFETIEIPVRVLPGRTITYNGEMKPVK